MSTAYEYVSQQSERSGPRLLRVPEGVMSKLGSVEDTTSVLEDSEGYIVTRERVDTEGVTVREVSFFDVSHELLGGPAVRDRIAGYVTQVRQHPEWEGPMVKLNEQGGSELVYNNPAAEDMYAAMPAMASWRKELVPSAIALYPLQYPEENYLPNGIEIDDLTRAMFTHSLDGIGIRTRAKAMSHLASQYVNPEGATNWTSLACGAAVPVLDAIHSNSEKIEDINLRLINFDPSALSFAGDLAESRSLIEGKDFELMNRNLLRDLIATDKLVQELGAESMDFVDALGIFEYFKDDPSARFLANAYKLVKPGGALVAANMLDTHPEIDFNQRVIGWPTIYPRSIEDLKKIISKAGIDLENVSMTVPSDGIYAIFEIKK